MPFYVMISRQFVIVFDKFALHELLASSPFPDNKGLGFSSCLVLHRSNNKRSGTLSGLSGKASK